MLGSYARSRIVEQIKLVAFIIIYLAAFQVIILNVPLANALSLAGGIALVVLGLAFFLEGLILGLMPVGERVGLKLPARVGITVIALFGMLLGFGSTLAEPAISALRAAGATVTAWDAPLLYMLLERYTGPLVLSIGVGVGIAVAFGMIRFYYGLSLKPFIYTIIPLVLILSVIYTFNDNLSSILGLAWDSGAVTTGAVTVPLVLSLGMGVSRAAGKSSGGGFGVIMLASAFPILAVLVTGFFINSFAPDPVSERELFSQSNRENAMLFFTSEEGLEQHAFRAGTEEARRALYSDEESYLSALALLKSDLASSQLLLGPMSYSEWLSMRASPFEADYLAQLEWGYDHRAAERVDLQSLIKEEGAGALQAVLPLCALLLLVLLLLRQRLRYGDEVALGITFALIGMALLTGGIRLGLAPLGGQVGAQLPRAFSTEEQFVERVVIEDFSREILIPSVDRDGNRIDYFHLAEDGEMTRVLFQEGRYDPGAGRYEHVITRSPMFRPDISFLGIALVLLFAFGMGFGSTLAEPALNALGRTVEELTVGTVKRTDILWVVSLGVGLGLVSGVSRIMFDIPLMWLIVPAYIVVLFLTWYTDDDFTSIAWDCGGVTTGPVTVPLVLAMGLSIGSELNVIDGFGILSMASVFPILTVSAYSLYARMRQRRSIKQSMEDQS